MVKSEQHRSSIYRCEKYSLLQSRYSAQCTVNCALTVDIMPKVTDLLFPPFQRSPIVREGSVLTAYVGITPNLRVL
jgi:hypothetical protein